ncbi:uncharacterized protein LOC125308170 [Alosa alosa]|uniref:uncharacterized protein LOC125308170 n=1 Tax=Alosa alosa TaxID=278164 RepID=UPI0020150BA0|nr:uncharacterized protein LOC125308170 [Alosa alosa]
MLHLYSGIKCIMEIVVTTTLSEMKKIIEHSNGTLQAPETETCNVNVKAKSPNNLILTQLTSILELLAKEAVDKICRLVSEGLCCSPVESETLKENVEQMGQRLWMELIKSNRHEAYQQSSESCRQIHSTAQQRKEDAFDLHESDVGGCSAMEEPGAGKSAEEKDWIRHEEVEQLTEVVIKEEGFKDNPEEADTDGAHEKLLSILSPVISSERPNVVTEKNETEVIPSDWLSIDEEWEEYITEWVAEYDSYEKARRKLVKFCKGNGLESTDEDSVWKRVSTSAPSSAASGRPPVQASTSRLHTETGKTKKKILQ